VTADSGVTPSSPPPSPSPALHTALAGGQAWYIVAVLTLANVSGFVDRQILALLVEPIKRDLGVTDTQVSLLMGLSFAVFYSVLGVPIGRLADRRSRRAIVAIGAALWSGLTALSGLARSFGQLFALRVGVGVGEATLGPSAVSLIADAFPRERRGSAMSVYMLGTFLGSGIAYALGAWVVGLAAAQEAWSLPLVGEVRPWQSVFFVVGLPGLVIAALAMTMREPARSAARTAAIPMREVLDYFRCHARTMLTLSFGFACSAAVNYGIGAWLATFFVRTHGWTATEAGTLQGALTMTVGVLGTLLGGWLTDRGVRAGRVDAPVTVGLVAAVGMLVTAGAYPLVSSATAAAVLLVPVNLFAAMPWGAANAAVAEALPARMRGQGSAVYFLVVNLFAGAFGPTAVALLTDRVFGDPAALRWSLAVCTVAGMTITIVLLGIARGAYRTTVTTREA
jgi:MFS family permease